MNDKITIKTALLIFGAIAGYLLLTVIIEFFLEMLFEVSFLEAVVIVGIITTPLLHAVWDKISATIKADNKADN